MFKFKELPQPLQDQLTRFKDRFITYKNERPEDEKELIYFDPIEDKIVGVFIKDFGFAPNLNYFDIFKFINFNEDDTYEFFRFIVIPHLKLKKYYGDPDRRVKLLDKNTFNGYRKLFDRNMENGYIKEV